MHVSWRSIHRFGDDKRLAEAPKEESRCRFVGGPVLMTTTTTDDGAAVVATSSPPNGQGRMPLALRPTPSAVPAAPEEDADRRPRRSSPVTAVDCVAEPRLQQPRPPLLMDVAIRCTAPSCSCDCFSPCKSQIRTCDSCNHGWVSHALDKLGFRHLFNCHQVELVQPSIAFDVASLMLYGTQAVPVRLKILLDRLFSVLRREEVLQVLHGFGWTYEDYARGYILRDPTGHVLDRWSMASVEEEPFILQQFLRFGETKTIAQQLLLQEKSEGTEFFAPAFFRTSESDIKKLIDRSVKSTSNATTVCSCTAPMPKLGSCHSMYSMAPTVTLPLVSKIPFRQPTSSVSSTRSLSPNALSPVNNCCSPISSLSPLNRLQNMQPYDYRREKCSPEVQRTSELNPVVTSSAISTSTAVSYSSPLSSPATSSLAISTSSATSLNPRVHGFHSNNNINSDYSGPEDDLDDMDDSSSNAINLSSSATPSTSYLDSIFAARKVRHLRKSANPMKRRWNPMVLATLATNPATGKKRVQCNVCLKTFCDKGALKIHFSAVHLREMHKCTVDGCNMMFSSRRSRNRHSANPNPKLHTPNYRRKINPHDGRAANPYPMIPSSGLTGFSTSPYLPNSLPNHFEGDSNTMTEGDTGKNPDFSYTTKQEDCGEEDLENNRLTEPTNLSLQTRNTDNELPLQLTKKRCLEDMRIHHNAINTKTEATSNGNTDKGTEDGGMDLSMKEAHRVSSSSSAKGVRKRKSLNPTKCPVNSDDELQYVTTDDSSSDTYIDHDNDENGLNDSKSDDLTSDGLDSKDDDDDLDSKKVLDGAPSSSCSSPISQCSTPKMSQATTYSTISTPSNIPKPFLNEKHNGYSVLNSTKGMDLLRKDIVSDRLRENEDISENPLRHLESLSLGAFANMMSGSQRSHLNRVTHGSSSGVSYHAPGLGLGSTPMETTRPESPQPIHEDRISQYLNHGRPLLSPPSSQHVGPINSDPENSLSDQQLSLHPVYRDASNIASLEIPVDKENPRRCTACGKIFQNHFGVKTHYQNVHLKLMHKCTVEGCNAAFPSKRSRDRHSANLNLHRKLLSTSSEKPQTSFFDKGATGLYPYHPDALRSEFFSRLYDPQTHLPLNFAELYHSRLSTAEAGGFLPGTQYPAHLIPGFHPAFMMPHAASALPPRRHSDNGGNGESGRDSPVSSIMSSPTTLSPRPAESCVSPPERKPSIKLEGDLQPDAGGRYSCDICEKKFHESVVLREHYEKCHSNLLVKCVEDGCDKVFLSGRTRNLHTDEVHHRENIPTVS